MVQKLALILVLCSGFAIAGPVVLNFDDLTGQAAMPSPYGGVNFPDWSYYDWSQPPFNAHSGNTRIYNFDGVPTVTFVTPEVFDGAWFAGYNTAQMNLYLGGTLVDTTGTIYLSDVPQYLVSGYSGMVDEIQFAVTPGEFVMDDFTYTTPEPASLLLAGAGVLFLMVRRRKGR